MDFPIYGAGSRSLRRLLVLAGTGRRASRHLRDGKSVRALDKVSLAFEHGDRVALVGANGAGKTTLLRVLAGIYEPTAGRVERRGRTASLLDVSLGLDMESTGHENILTRGMLVGLGPREIRARAREIAEFTELGDYLDMPAWTYSSGMLYRLGFAVSTCFETEILLMDEWISTGDRSFVAKAERRLANLVARAGILVLASADEELLLRTCSKAVRLVAGRVVAWGPVRDVLGRG